MINSQISQSDNKIKFKNEGYTYIIDEFFDGSAIFKLRYICDSDINENEEKSICIIDFKNNDSYSGEVQYNQINGVGIYEFDDGTYCYGEFIDGKLNGRGYIKYLNGDIYRGELVNGKKHGIGVYCFENGDAYHGTFNNDYREGRGVYKNKEDNMKVIGTWKNNLLNGECVIQIEGKRKKVKFINDEMIMRDLEIDSNR